MMDLFFRYVPQLYYFVSLVSGVCIAVWTKRVLSIFPISLSHVSQWALILSFIPLYLFSIVDRDTKQTFWLMNDKTYFGWREFLDER